MQIPRQDTFGPEMPPRAHEEPARPALRPEQSSFTIDRVRTVVSRGSDTGHDADPRALFMRGAFADVPKSKAKVFDLGQPLFKDAHRRLIEALRDECARLHGYTQHLKSRVAEANHKALDAEAQVASLKAEVAATRAKLGQMVSENLTLQADLQAATGALSEVDAMFLGMRQRRLSRLNEQVAIHLAEPVALGDAVPSEHAR